LRFTTPFRDRYHPHFRQILSDRLMSDIDDWYRSGESVTVNGTVFRPVRHPVLDIPLAIARKQATTYVLHDPAGRRWFVKKFYPGRAPDARYLTQIRESVPSMPPFRAASARTVVGANQIVAPVTLSGIAAWLDGTVLMPRVPGNPWTDLLENLNGGGTTRLDRRRRFLVAVRLALATAAAEEVSVSHRDFSGGNIHVEVMAARIHLIDWDSAFVPNAPFQPNTVLGTEGYMAPWLSNAKDSWSTTADRFALAVMIAEVLTIDQGWQLSGDGALFGQDEIGTDGRGFQRTWRALRAIDGNLAGRFEQAWKADAFAECPSPFEWAGLVASHDPTCQEVLQRARREWEAARAWRVRGERPLGRLSMRWLTASEREVLRRQIVANRRTQVVRRAILSGDDATLARVAAGQTLESLGLRPSELPVAADGLARQMAKKSVEQALVGGTPVDLLQAWRAAVDAGVTLEAGVARALIRMRFDEVAPVGGEAVSVSGPAPASALTSSLAQSSQLRTDTQRQAVAEAEAALEAALASGDSVSIADASTRVIELGSAHLLDDPRVHVARAMVFGSRRLSMALSEAAA